MHRCRHLLVALPRTDADAGLIDYATMLARRGAAVEVRFVHVLPAGDEAARTRDRVLAAMEADVRDAFTDVPETVQSYSNVLKGPVVDRLLGYCAEQQVDMILVGHRSDHSSRRSLARRLAMKAPCSVWMVPDGSPAAIRRILVPVDFSKHAADALAVATSLAAMSGLRECLALHVYFDSAVARYEEYDEVIRGDEAQAFERFLEPLDCQGVRIEPLIEEGANVPHVIGRVADANGVDLIVMGTRGRSRSAAVLLGSETEQTLIETRVPLLAVKHHGARLGGLRALLDKDFILKTSPRFG